MSLLRHSLLLSILLASPTAAQNVDSLLARMTLEEKLGQLNLLSAGGRAAAAAGISWTYAPMVDIARDPRWGRIAEGSGEDPYLGSLMAAARVKGFQQNIFATAKHFAGYGAAEAGREYNETEISQRTMREIYLPPFKAAVDAGVASLMSAFNDVAGVPASGNAWLTDTVLRREWRFPGFVVSDWTSVAELINHGVAGSQAEAGRRALMAGVDMDMQSGIYVDSLAALVGTRIPMPVVDSAVMRILRAKTRLGLFRDPYRPRTAPPTSEIRSLARRVAGESIVLLKNERSLLPLDPKSGTIVVIGPLADNKEEPLGPWHTQGQAADVVTVLQGIKAKVPAAPQVLYAQGSGIEDSSTAGFAAAVAAARQAKVAILVLGERGDMSGEAA